jgi:hypothetical protein
MYEHGYGVREIRLYHRAYCGTGCMHGLEWVDRYPMLCGVLCSKFMYYLSTRGPLGACQCCSDGRADGLDGSKYIHAGQFVVSVSFLWA